MKRSVVASTGHRGGGGASTGSCRGKSTRTHKRHELRMGVPCGSHQRLLLLLQLLLVSLLPPALQVQASNNPHPHPKPGKAEQYLYTKTNVYPIMEYKLNLLEQSLHKHNQVILRPSFLLDVTSPRIVHFYLPSSELCQTFQPHYVHMARELKKRGGVGVSQVKFHAVSCTVHHGVCMDLGIQGVPAVMAFPRGGSTGVPVHRTADGFIQVETVADILGINLKNAIVDPPLHLLHHNKEQEDDDHQGGKHAGGEMTTEPPVHHRKHQPSPQSYSFQVREHLQDAELALWYTLLYGIFPLHPTPPSTFSRHQMSAMAPPPNQPMMTMEKAQAFQEWMDLLHWALPSYGPVQAVIHEVRDNVIPITSAKSGKHVLWQILQRHVGTAPTQWSEDCGGDMVDLVDFFDTPAAAAAPASAAAGAAGGAIANNNKKQITAGGYPCGLWKLLHILSLGVAQQHTRVLGDRRRVSPLHAADVMRDGLVHFVGSAEELCVVCVLDFLAVYDGEDVEEEEQQMKKKKKKDGEDEEEEEVCKFGICHGLKDVHGRSMLDLAQRYNTNSNNLEEEDDDGVVQPASAEHKLTHTLQESDWQKLALVLWEYHNDVNQRIWAEEDRQALAKKKKKKNKKRGTNGLQPQENKGGLMQEEEEEEEGEEEEVQREWLWPDESSCPNCWRDGSRSLQSNVAKRGGFGFEGGKGWVEEEVFAHLKRRYWAEGMQNARFVVLDRVDQKRRKRHFQSFHQRLARHQARLLYSSILLILLLVIGFVRYWWWPRHQWHVLKKRHGGNLVVAGRHVGRRRRQRQQQRGRLGSAGSGGGFLEKEGSTATMNHMSTKGSGGYHVQGGVNGEKRGHGWYQKASTSRHYKKMEDWHLHNDNNEEEDDRHGREYYQEKEHRRRRYHAQDYPRRHEYGSRYEEEDSYYQDEYQEEYDESGSGDTSTHFDHDDNYDEYDEDGDSHSQEEEDLSIDVVRKRPSSSLHHRGGHQHYKKTTEGPHRGSHHQKVHHHHYHQHQHEHHYPHSSSHNHHHTPTPARGAVNARKTTTRRRRGTNRWSHRGGRIGTEIVVDGVGGETAMASTRVDRSEVVVMESLSDDEEDWDLLLPVGEDKDDENGTKVERKQAKEELGGGGGMGDVEEVLRFRGGDAGRGGGGGGEVFGSSTSVSRGGIQQHGSQQIRRR